MSAASGEDLLATMQKAIETMPHLPDTQPLRFFAAGPHEERWARENLIGGVEIVRADKL